MELPKSHHPLSVLFPEHAEVDGIVPGLFLPLLVLFLRAEGDGTSVVEPEPEPEP